MRTMLGKIRNFVDNFAEVISDVLDTDVIITDSNMNIVGSAFRYFSLYNDIKVGTLLADVLVNNHNLVIRNKAQIESCRKCREYKKCKMKGFVGVPIHYGNQTLGAIALILPSSKVKALFENIDSTVIFMERMAELVASRIHYHTEKKALSKKMAEFESILDLMDEALVHTDVYGNVIYFNKKFEQDFGADKDLIGENITSVYPELRDWYEKENVFKDFKICIQNDRCSFYGIVNSKRVYQTEEEYTVILCFQPYKNIYKTSKIFMPGTQVTFRWLRKFCDVETLALAEYYAELDEPVLICGCDDTLNEMLGKAIYNQSPRRLEEVEVLHIRNSYRNLLNSYLSAETGILRKLQNGTIIIMQPEKIPMYIQEYLLNLMEKKKTAGSQKEPDLDIRFIFCTTSDLEELVKEKKFNEELYRIISKNKISMTKTLHEDFGVFYRYMQSGLEYYSSIYKKETVELSIDRQKEIWRKCKGNLLADLEMMIERIAKSGDYILEEEKTENPEKSINELEKMQLQKLIKDGYSKQEMAKIMNISRTTLYRHLKEYDLQ